ncbi:MAG: MGMT family protein [Candidatus Sericytochromatia bacterium]
MSEASFRNRVLALVRRIPAGRVATYGQIARLAGHPRAPRQIGGILAGLRAQEDDVPWQRVINAQGAVSPRPSEFADLQQPLLEAEGIVFDANGRCDLGRYQWNSEQVTGNS